MTSLIERIDTLAQTYAARTGSHATVLYVGQKEATDLECDYHHKLKVKLGALGGKCHGVYLGALRVVQVKSPSWLQVGEVLK